MLRAQPAGGYRFVAGDGHLPCCEAVIADDGYAIVRAQLERPLPWRDGFRSVERRLNEVGRPRQALCAVELRCAAPYTPDGFAAFNEGYAGLLREWGLYVGGTGNATRTNVAPEAAPPSEQSMYAFAYTLPAADAAPTWVLSGATEADGVGSGTSPEAIRAKVGSVVHALSERLVAIDQSWEAATRVSLYTVHDAQTALRSELLPRLGAAAVRGVCWFPSRPPIVGLDLEIDARCVRQELILT